MSTNVKKAGKISGMVTSMIMLALIMVVNVQIGLNDGDSTDIGLFGLKASVFVPSSVATEKCSSGTQTCHSGPSCNPSVDSPCTHRTTCEGEKCYCEITWISSIDSSSQRCNWQ